jgi:hypothetical protein
VTNIAEPSEGLTKAEWAALDSLVDDVMEPIEEVSRALRDYGLDLTSGDFLALLFGLFRRGFVTVRQAPIPAFGQAFEERVLSPTEPGKMMGELEHCFQESYAAGDYLRRVAIPADSPPTGVPFGIYIELTPAGRAEWDNPLYKPFWPPDEV